MLESAFKSVRKGLEDRRSSILHVKTGGLFPATCLCGRGALFLESLGKVVLGRGEAQGEKMGREKGRFAGTIRNHQSVGYSKRLSRAEG